MATQNTSLVWQRIAYPSSPAHVALEMGNSAGIVMKHYFDIVDGVAARAYWNIRPLRRGDHKVVRMKGAA